MFREDLVREVPGARSMSRRDIRPLDHWKGMTFLFFLTRMCLTSAVSVFRLLAVDAVSIQVFKAFLLAHDPLMACDDRFVGRQLLLKAVQVGKAEPWLM